MEKAETHSARSSPSALRHAAGLPLSGEAGWEQAARPWRPSALTVVVAWSAGALCFQDVLQAGRRGSRNGAALDSMQ